MKEILRLDHVSKSFVGVKAMQDISFDLRAGEIHCICGENGAGKSTLIKMLSGAHTPDAGDISFEGKKVELHPPPRDAAGHPDDIPGAHRLPLPERHGEHLRRA